MLHLVKDLERELSVISRNLRQPVVLADGSVVQRSTASPPSLLAEHEPMRMGAVAAALNVDKSTTTRQVQYAIRLGLLDRVGNPHGRRVHLLSLIPAGREMYKSMVYRRRQGLLINIWSDRDREELVRLLSLFNAEVSQLRAAASTATGTS